MKLVAINAKIDGRAVVLAPEDVELVWTGGDEAEALRWHLADCVLERGQLRGEADHLRERMEVARRHLNDGNTMDADYVLADALMGSRWAVDENGLTPADHEPLGSCVVHGDYWGDYCVRCQRERGIGASDKE